MFVTHKQTFAKGEIIKKEIVGDIYRYLVRWEKDNSETWETSFTIRYS